MHINKKAQVLKVLVGIILALAIWIPTCMFIATFYNPSNQALETVGKIADIINSMEYKSKGELDSQLLVMDEETILVAFYKGLGPITTKTGLYYEFSYFEPDILKDTRLVVAPGAWVLQKFGDWILYELDQGIVLSGTVIIPRPNVEECKGKACLCLGSFERKDAVTRQASITFKKVRCEELKLSILDSEKSSPLMIRSKIIQGRMSAKERAVYIEKGEGDTFGLCSEALCLT